MEYDEDREIQRQVLVYHRHLLTAGEWARVRREGERYKRMHREWAVDSSRRQHAGGEPPHAWHYEETAGHADFLRGVIRRVLREHAAEVTINRCPVCARVLRTPVAKICYWCGHSQYGEAPEPSTG